MGQRMRYKKKKHIKKLRKNPTLKTQNECMRLMKDAMKAVARAMKEEAVRKINEIGGKPIYVCRVVGKMKTKSADVVGGKFMRGNDGTLYLNEKERAKLWKAHISKILNEENE